ncbi:MAG: Stk1 family PASTA domain-containing Ser/Thr kinase [Tissierellia bacterium]|nr:Stk1 family PASTA domain-containing Ser/Thr kinase [Tissierellia bacterium]
MIGTTLGERYYIVEKIGEGGMAFVYKARCKLLNRYVAIKILRDEFVDDDEFVGKFRRESQAAASLSHPNIVNIYDVGVDEREGQKIYYIVMEYIKGETLKDIIRRQGKLSVDKTIDYSIQIAEALGHAHKNHIVHRDIKPHNIMITEDGRAKVTDFGIARAVTSSTVTNTSNVIGSVHYFSPEQARGGYTDEKSDIYSLGIVMYEMITGQVPYKGDSPITVALKHIQDEIQPPKELDSTIPTNLQNIIMKSASKRQVDRYITVNELLRDLRRVQLDKDEAIIDHTAIMESPTQMIPAIKDGRSNEEEGSGKEADKENGKGNWKITVLAILLAFIVVSVSAFGFFKLRDFFKPDEIIVPDLVGMEHDEAKEEVEELGLKFSIAGEVHDDEFDIGYVVSQRNKAGEKVKPGYTIEVFISKGSNLVGVPNLTNRNRDEIRKILKEYDLVEGLVDYKHSDTVEANFIISQNPEPQSRVEKGTRINIVVSQGPEKRLITMPRLVGLTEKEAKNAIVANKLVLGQITSQPNNQYPKGIVIWQSVEQGNQLEPNTSVNIHVSSGPEEKPKPQKPKPEKPRPEEPEPEIPDPEPDPTPGGPEESGGNGGSDD